MAPCYRKATDHPIALRRDKLLLEQVNTANRGGRCVLVCQGPLARFGGMFSLDQQLRAT